MNQAACLPQRCAFTPAVKALQSAKGSRRSYAHMEEAGGWRTDIDGNLAAFVGAQTSVFLATANAEGQPYIQHRGGPAGFLRVLDPKTIAFADFRGNRQYITLGNLTENPKAYLFLIDYARRQRIKIWGSARSSPTIRLCWRACDRGLQGDSGTGDPVQGRGLGLQLPAAHSSAFRGGRRGWLRWPSETAGIAQLEAELASVRSGGPSTG